MPIAILALGIIVDQIIKIWVKTHFLYGESMPVFGDWFKLYFIENNGMAFGKELFGGSRMGKYILTFFRIGVSVFGFWFLWSQMIKKAPKGLLIAIALIMAGAVGNIIDSIFYGVFFQGHNAYSGSWFEGQVVDMFYAPMWEGHLPEWLPLWGGDFFVFFSPIWNFADACITVGVALMILGQRRFFG
jgi:signal peptidase II